MAVDSADIALPFRPVASDEPQDENEAETEGRRVVRRTVMTAALAGSGVAGRVTLQGVPSVEPIVPLAIVTGFLVSWRHGAAIGASGFYTSNFLVWGGHGPWTLFQCLGAALAAVAGAAFARMHGGRRTMVGALVTGTVVYEIVVNLGSVMTTPWLLATGVAGLIAALPYAAIHIGSSIGFGGVLYGIREPIKNGYGEH